MNDIKINSHALYSRGTLARACGVTYGRLYQAERRGECPGPTVRHGRRYYYTTGERDAVVEWAKIKVRTDELVA